MRAVHRGGKRALRAGLGWLVRGLMRSRTYLPPSTWRLQSDSVAGLKLDGVALADLCERHGSPLHVVDALKLVGNANAFLERPEGASRSCQVVYSYKTNPVARVLQILHGRGIGAEVTSDHELWLARRLGVKPESIVVNGTAKSRASMREAVEGGVALINLNGGEELEELSAIARALGKRPKVGIRVLADDGWAGQLGEDSGAALKTFAEALRRPELEVVGVHVHRGPEITTRRVLDRFVSGVLRFCDRLREELSFEPAILDLGGSLCCPTVAPLSPTRIRLNRAFGGDLKARLPTEVLGIREYVAGLMATTETHYRRRGRPVPRILIEPGRAMTANAQFLLATVLRVKRNGEIGHLILNAGVNVAQPLQTEFHAIYPVRPRAAAPRKHYRLVGPISSPGDILCHACELPELEQGDVVAIMDTGAYFVSFSTSFSFRQPGIVLIEDGKEALVRRAETSEDLVARDL